MGWEKKRMVRVIGHEYVRLWALSPGIYIHTYLMMNFQARGRIRHVVRVFICIGAPTSFGFRKHPAGLEEALASGTPSVPRAAVD